MRKMGGDFSSRRFADSEHNKWGMLTTDEKQLWQRQISNWRKPPRRSHSKYSHLPDCTDFSLRNGTWSKCLSPLCGVCSLSDSRSFFQLKSESLYYSSLRQCWMLSWDGHSVWRPTTQAPVFTSCVPWTNSFPAWARLSSWKMWIIMPAVYRTEPGGATRA